MTTRNRTQTIPTPKGKVVTGGVLAAGGNYNVVGAEHYCGDQTGPGDCHPFHSSHLTIEGGRVNVHNNSSNYWENYRVDWLDVANFTHIDLLSGGNLSDVAYATMAAARSNPSRPYVDVPIALIELGDIARTLRRQGLNSIAAAGRQNLRYQFGILPIVSDLVKLANFQDQVQRRIRMMERLEAPRGYRRTLSMGGWSDTVSYSRVMQSNQFFWTDTVYQTTTQNVRAHVRWLPEGNYRTLSSSDRQRLALRSALGGTFDSSTVWETIPWTWLIDWCSTAGEYFSANRNIIPATLSGVHIMRETRSEFTTMGGINSPIKVVLVDRTRNPSFVAPTAHFPFLGAGQMSILASLAVTR